MGKWLGTKNYGENGGRGNKNRRKGSLVKQPQTTKYPSNPIINVLYVSTLSYMSTLKDEAKGRCSRNWV